MLTKDELKEKFSTGKKPTGADFSSLIDGIEGPEGPEGPRGEQGIQGAEGPAGFGTETQYNDIINRLEALENPET